jgi:hypothetical protein
VERPTSKDGPRRTSAKDRKQGAERVRLTAVIAVALVAALVVWLLVEDGDSGSEPEDSAATTAAVKVVPEGELLEALKGVGYPVYWAGPRLGVEYEVSRAEAGRTYVRYLPEGEEAGSVQPFLTVGSYQQPGALARIRELGQEPGAILVSIAGGGAAYAAGPEATNAYMAFPEVGTQVEVFDPREGRALRLIRSGAVVPVS